MEEFTSQNEDSNDIKKLSNDLLILQKSDHSNLSVTI
jgi:hypothetical protein